MKKTFAKAIIVLFSFFFNYSAPAQSPFIGLVVTTVPNTGFTNCELTYRLYAELSSGIVTQMFGDETRPHSIVTTTTFFNQDLFGTHANLQSEVNTGAFGFLPALEWDTWTTLGDSYTSGASTLGDVGFGSNLFGSTWSFGGTVNSDASIFRLPTDPLCIPDANGLVLLGQFTTNGVLSGYINLNGLDNDGNPWEENQIPIPQIQVTNSGCTNPLACNYDLTAYVDDCSCVYETTSISNITECDSYTWNGVTYTTSGAYTYNTTNSNGCDTIATLNLVINTPTTSTTNESACNTYTWNGSTYNASGAYTYNTTNSNGCDSTATLNLTINPSVASTTPITSCVPITWNGSTYSTTGSYIYLTTNTNGCDSTATLNLTISPSVTSTTPITSCVPIIWNGITYSTTGTYTYLTTNTNGCDSIANLSLTISTASVTANITVDACNEYYWNGTNYENSGVYNYTTTNNFGCDSTTILTLNVFDDEIYIPNTFTPNTIDNINDRFYIHNNLTEFKMWIYNRWGEEILFTEDGQLGWDGKYKNKICQNGLYVWRIIFVCGEKAQEKTGHIFLLK